MKILVTGGSGYFGSCLIKKLTKRGSFQIASLDLSDADDRPQAVEFFRADIRDLDAVSKACIGVDIVLHNVAQVPLANNSQLFESVNVGGVETLLKACLENKVKKVVYTSSSAVFGVPQNLPITETTPTLPKESYGATKLAAEKVCAEYIQKGLDISIVRPRTILGGNGRLGIFQILFEWVSEGRHIPMFGDGSYPYQFVHSDDLAEVCIRAGERAGSSIYNCGAERYGTMRDILQALCDHAKTGAKPRSIPMAPAALAMKIINRLGLSPLTDWHWLSYGIPYYFDTSKIRTELGYTAKYSNDEMICESYDWYIANRDRIHYIGEGASTHRSAVKQGILNLIKWMS
ncbi:NAD-dependent epimerase/dehydratase family protein [Deferribacterales bacterium RsTz2092]